MSCFCWFIEFIIIHKPSRIRRGKTYLETVHPANPFYITSLEMKPPVQMAEERTYQNEQGEKRQAHEKGGKR